MSSAILYVAIVVIWACVLIPRWLRRDPARGSAHATDQAAPAEVAPPGNIAPPGDDVTARGDAAPLAADSARTEVEEMVDDPPQQEEAPPPLTAEESRRRILSARRRLLGMLIVLEAAAILLAVFKLAALWVVIPPSIMLAGYLLILREASHADAQRAAWEAEAAAHARARARERGLAHEQAVRQGAPVPRGATSEAPARPAVQYDDMGPGRDFAPGLAGKYTTSNAEIIDITARASDDIQHESPNSELRAVGD